MVPELKNEVEEGKRRNSTTATLTRTAETPGGGEEQLHVDSDREVREANIKCTKKLIISILQLATAELEIMERKTCSRR